ncbi:hypothetical protein [Alkalinema sp. FACHB-956]|nr:hypothetical protein [Alkalinema sp. FACHB-956]MBD2325668.1 hypothetical protein [Alkalinema sp. FACHB-956]
MVGKEPIQGSGVGVMGWFMGERLLGCNTAILALGKIPRDRVAGTYQ